MPAPERRRNTDNAQIDERAQFGATLCDARLVTCH
jgi:hypothetical protein